MVDDRLYDRDCPARQCLDGDVIICGCNEVRVVDEDAAKDLVVGDGYSFVIDKASIAEEVVLQEGFEYDGELGLDAVEDLVDGLGVGIGLARPVG